MRIIQLKKQKMKWFDKSNEYVKKIIKEKEIDVAVSKVKAGQHWPKHRYTRLEGGKSFHLFFDGKWKLKINRNIISFDGTVNPTLIELDKKDWIEGKVVDKKDGLVLSFFSPPFQLKESEY